MNSRNTSYLRSLQMVHFALGIGMISFLVVCFVLHGSEDWESIPELSNIFTMVVPIVLLAGIVVGSWFYNKRIEGINQTATVQQKLETYRTVFVIRLALHEGPTLFAIVAYLLTVNQWFLHMVLISIAGFVLLRPTADKIATTLSLSDKEVNAHLS